MTTHSHTYRTSFTALDDYLAVGVTYCHYDEDGTLREEQPLASPIGARIAIRVRYRCSRCRKQFATVEDYTADNGQQVWLFIGKTFRYGYDSGAAPALEVYTHFAFLLPDYGREPFCACPTHGPLRIDAERVRRDTEHSVELEKGRRRKTEKESSTRTIALPPMQPDWTPTDFYGG